MGIFHSAFRTKEARHFGPSPTTADYESVDFDVYWTVAKAIDDELGRRPSEDAEAVGEEAASVLIAAFERRPAVDVRDPFEIYDVLLQAPTAIIEDVFNRIFVDDF